MAFGRGAEHLVGSAGLGAGGAGLGLLVVEVFLVLVLVLVFLIVVEVVHDVELVLAHVAHALERRHRDVRHVALGRDRDALAADFGVQGREFLVVDVYIDDGLLDVVLGDAAAVPRGLDELLCRRLELGRERRRVRRLLFRRHMYPFDRNADE